MTTPGSSLRRWQRLLLGVALLCWPRAARSDVAEGMIQTFLDRRGRVVRSGRGTGLDTWLEAFDVAKAGIQARWQDRGRRGRSGGAKDFKGGSGEGGNGMIQVMGQVILTGVRGVRMRAASSLLVIAILAIGIGAGTAIFSVVDGVAIRSLPYESPDELIRIGGVREGRPGLSTVSGPNFRDLESATTQLSSVAASTPSSIAIALGTGPAELLRGGYVSGAFFTTLGGEALMGRVLTPDDDHPTAPPALVLSHSLWLERFGGADILGVTVQVEGAPATVVGVMPPDFHPPEAAHLGGTQFWLPLAHSTLPVGERGLAFLDVVGRRAAGVTPQMAEAELTAIGSAIGETWDLSPRAFGGFASADLTAETLGDSSRMLGMLSAVVLVLLALVGANVANLILLRTLDRIGDIRIRVGLGASRARVLAELVTESLLLSTIAGAAGAGMAAAALSAIKRSAPVDLPRLTEVGVDGRVLIFTIALSVLTGVIVGLLPALRALRARSLGVPGVRGAGGDGGRGRLRDGLVVLQVGMGLVLMTSAGLLMRSLVGLQSVDPGLDADGLTVASLRLQGVGGPDSDLTLFDQLLAGARRLPGVDQVSITSGAPYTGGGWTTYVAPEGVELAEDVLRSARIGLHQVSPGHLAHVGLDLVSGRGFQPRDVRGAGDVVVISESVARKYLGEASPLGRRLMLGGDGTFAQRTVVGVVRDPLYAGPTGEPEEHIWVPVSQFPPESIDLILTTSDPTGLNGPLREMLGRVDPSIAIRSMESMSTARSRYFTEPAFLSALMGTFAGIALLLSAVVLYGTLAYLVKGRRRELGVRLALGAEVPQLVRSVVFKGFGVTGAGVVVGLLVGTWVVGGLEAFLFETRPTDGVAWGLAAVILVGAGVLASWIPARRIGQISPDECLRSQ